MSQKLFVAIGVIGIVVAVGLAVALTQTSLIPPSEKTTAKSTPATTVTSYASGANQTTSGSITYRTTATTTITSTTLNREELAKQARNPTQVVTVTTTVNAPQEVITITKYSSTITVTLFTTTTVKSGSPTTTITVTTTAVKYGSTQTVTHDGLTTVTTISTITETVTIAK